MVRPRTHTDEEILRVAREQFLAHGPATAIHRIAEVIGLSPPALFKRFGSKEELMLRALLPGPDIAWIEALEQGPGPGPLEAELEERLAQAMDFFDATLPCLMTLKAAGLDIHELVRRMPQPPPLRARRALAGWLERARAQGRIGPIDTDATAITLLGSVQVRAAMSHLFGDPPLRPEDRRAHARAVAALLWRGLRPEEIR